MISVGTAQASTGALYTPTLADISRNASVISSSSSSSSTSSLALNTPPVRPRPVRTFSSPRNASPAASPRNNSRPPAYLTGDMGYNDGSPNLSVEAKRDAARTRSQSRNRSINGRLTAEDFEFGEELGEGSYSTVKRATLYTTGQEYAIKILDKGHLKRYGKLDTALAEKNTLVRLGSGHPGIVRLHSTFQDDWSLFFVLDLARNGEMQSRISRLGSLSTECTRYYSAQIVDALDYMHMKDVIHRDLKPENLLLDDDFRIKITDFGTGKLLGPGEQTAKTFVGTSQYVSPELLEANETSKSSDLWALGCIIYQMMAGRFTFTGLSDYLTWQKIKQVEYSFPDGFDEQAKDLVQKLIVRDPLQRLGAGAPGTNLSMQALREHPFLSTINWKTLWTDPAPPLEAGLVKREHPIAGHDQNWEDVGATWDDIAGDSDEDDSTDGIRWADDAVGPSYITGGGKVVELNGESTVEEGPMGEIATYRRSPLRMERHEEEDAETVMGQESPPSGTSPPSESVTDVGGTEPIDLPSARAGTGSSGSSSESGSPMEKLGAALEAIKMSRGRNRIPTPLQGNGVQPIDWTSVLLPDEKIVFSGPVEERALRRRASRLIPIQVSPLKPKSRQLILTSRRLVCVKQRDRGVISVKHELLAQAPKIVSAKDKNHIVGVEAKSSKEFVVMTSGKSQTYAAPDAEVASSWIDQIRAIFEAKQPVQQT